MKRIIRTTDLKGLKPLFNNRTESIQRFHELKDFFSDHEAYKVFSEPTLALKSDENHVDWQTELPGTETPYEKLTDEQKETAKGMLKTQVNYLYNQAFYHTQSEEQKKRIISILDNAIEIPDLSHVYFMLDEQNLSSSLLTSWGFIYSKFNAPSGIIKSLIPIKVKDIEIKVFYENGDPAENEIIFTEIAGRVSKIDTSKEAVIRLKDIPFDAKISFFQEEKQGGKRFNQQFITCERPYKYTITLKKKGVLPAMKILLKDVNDNIKSNVEIFFSFNGKKIQAVSDEMGIVTLKDVKPGQQIECYQIFDDLKYNQGSIEFDPSKKTHEFILKEDLATAVKTRINVVDKKMLPITNQNISVFIRGKKVKFNTSQDGSFSLYKMAAGEQIQAQLGKGSKKYRGQLTIVNPANSHQLIMAGKQTIFFWLILFVLFFALIAATWFFFLMNRGEQPGKHINVVLLDSINGKPISNARVNLIFDQDTLLNRTAATDMNGVVNFSFPSLNQETYTLKIDKMGYEKFLKQRRFKENNHTMHDTIKILSIEDGGLLGETGDLKINLKWNTKDDLDLYVYDPCGNKIYFKMRDSKCKGYSGKLDLDANGSTANEITNNPQENIYWIDAPPGIYSIFIENNHSRTRQPVDYDLTIKNKNEIEHFKGTIEEVKKQIPVTSITFKE